MAATQPFRCVAFGLSQPLSGRNPSSHCRIRASRASGFCQSTSARAASAAQLTRVKRSGLLPARDSAQDFVEPIKIFIAILIQNVSHRPGLCAASHRVNFHTCPRAPLVLHTIQSARPCFTGGLGRDHGDFQLPSSFPIMRTRISQGYSAAAARASQSPETHAKDILSQGSYPSHLAACYYAAATGRHFFRSKNLGIMPCYTYHSQLAVAAFSASRQASRPLFCQQGIMPPHIITVSHCTTPSPGKQGIMPQAALRFHAVQPSMSSSRHERLPGSPLSGSGVQASTRVRLSDAEELEATFSRRSVHAFKQSQAAPSCSLSRGPPFHPAPLGCHRPHRQNVKPPRHPHNLTGSGGTSS